MWQPSLDLDPLNRCLVLLEQRFLAVLRKSKQVEELFASAELAQLFELIDANPYQAVAMTRIKSGHTMTPRHGLNVLLLARAWAVSCHKLGKRLEPFSKAALVHDLGHWRPDDLIYTFENFSHSEFERLKTHAKAALSEIPLEEEAQTWIAQHHEQPDGRGYPNGITDPHPLAQLLRICDCYDGLTTARRFRGAHTPHRAMTMMGRWAGFKFDAGLFASFRLFLGGDHPFGSFVKLRSGPLAMMLPPLEEKGVVLEVTNDQGDPLEASEARALQEGEIRDEGFQWQQIKLPEPWRNARPDLLNLPRIYSP